MFRQSDIHIFPSGCEGSPKSVYEACASGLAQITTFESGDVVRDEVNGLIVPPNDVVALANAIRRLYKSPRRILQYGRAARQRAETEFTWDHFRERLARAYDLVLRAEHPVKILLLQIKRIGDLILTTPSIRCLREAFPTRSSPW